LENSKAYKHRRIGGRAGKMRLAHHIIWENAYGPILKGFEIHHIDHNKQNNDLENLICISKFDHQKFHSPNFTRVDNKWYRICPDCRQLDLFKIRNRPLCDVCRARRARIERRSK
jgi:hypothetical protein